MGKPRSIGGLAARGIEQVGQGQADGARAIEGAHLPVPWAGVQLLLARRRQGAQQPLQEGEHLHGRPPDAAAAPPEHGVGVRFVGGKRQVVFQPEIRVGKRDPVDRVQGHHPQPAVRNHVFAGLFGPLDVPQVLRGFAKPHARLESSRAEHARVAQRGVRHLRLDPDDVDVLEVTPRRGPVEVRSRIREGAQSLDGHSRRIQRARDVGSLPGRGRKLAQEAIDHQQPLPADDLDVQRGEAWPEVGGGRGVVDLDPRGAVARQFTVAGEFDQRLQRLVGPGLLCCAQPADVDDFRAKAHPHPAKGAVGLAAGLADPPGQAHQPALPCLAGAPRQGTELFDSGVGHRDLVGVIRFRRWRHRTAGAPAPGLPQGLPQASRSGSAAPCADSRPGRREGWPPLSRSGEGLQ